ncbi:DUF4883 family protein [Clostridium thermobutyricum]|uniref:Lipoprotein n=1 Tax=Clostridium thermobutyricum TaxID=29372 RepID=N9Y593_9CLOT|nr:DUF4883 family protein [Clostridium thermobutyricum]ENZ03369.1 hypothetical protein HMPREF1092_00555 [Clostridium thermobutyricum]
MKKLFCSLFFIIIISLQGCSDDFTRYINLKDNTSKNYYYNEIIKKFSSNEPFELEVFDNNFYKTFKVEDEYKNIITGFFNSLTSDNFIDPIEKKADEKLFEIIIKFKSETYYVTIIDENSIYISPYDGYIKSDFIDMSKIDKNYNLYSFCKFITNKKEPL